MVVILTGATKNVGDYLIGDRAKKLIREFFDEDIIELSRFNKIESSDIEIINNSKALVLCGGPAYAKNVFEGVYKLDSIIDKINVPIIPYGLGWSGKPLGNPESFRFTNESSQFLSKIHTKINSSSCRDIITEEILHNNGIKNVTMTGCPVWYDLDSIGQEFANSFNPKDILITTPASPRFLFLNTKLVKLIHSEFPDAKITLSFHRGILWDKETSVKHSMAYILMVLFAKAVSPKIKVVDVSYDLNKIDFYKNCDFHIGFRVHAHLHFLSRRKPSLLINEDGRGEGMVKSLGQESYTVNDDQILSKIKSKIRLFKEGHLDEFREVQKKIDSNFEIMKSFLSNLKNEKNQIKNPKVCT